MCNEMARQRFLPRSLDEEIQDVLVVMPLEIRLFRLAFAPLTRRVSAEPVIFKKCRPIVQYGVDSIDEPNRLSVTQFYFQTRNIETTAESF